MYFLIWFCSIANKNNRIVLMMNKNEAKKMTRNKDIWEEFASILIYLVVSTQSFIHSRLNRKHDISLIEHWKRRLVLCLTIIVLGFDSIIGTISPLSWSFLYSSFLFLRVWRRLNDWLRCYCYVGLVAHFLFSSVWWWRAHAHAGLEYKPTTRAFIREFIVVIVIFVAVICMSIYIYVRVCVKFHSFSFSSFAMRCGDVTCEVHFPFNHHHMLFSHLYTINVIYLACTFIERTNEWMYFDDNSRLQQLLYHQLTSREREQHA